jgi:hypothetical protein
LLQIIIETMKVTKIRKAEYKVTNNGIEYIVMLNYWENNNVWYVYQDGEFIFDSKTKKKCLSIISRR